MDSASRAVPLADYGLAVLHRTVTSVTMIYIQDAPAGLGSPHCTPDYASSLIAQPSARELDSTNTSAGTIST